MLQFLRGGDIYAPEPLGIQDVVLAGEKIAAIIQPGSARVSGLPFHDRDFSGKTLVPGFIDNHVHILGGGGEGGPVTRAPEIKLETIIGSERRDHSDRMPGHRRHHQTHELASGQGQCP